ncbi:hypothetical protein TNCV_3762521 [Trichonephila clavipes]|nr:hypothetical protein TNCV_3762521 [Trichonephila clavipes]
MPMMGGKMPMPSANPMMMNGMNMMRPAMGMPLYRKYENSLTELEITEMKQNISDNDYKTDFDSSERETVIYSDCSVHNGILIIISGTSVCPSTSKERCFSLIIHN